MSPINVATGVWLTAGNKSRLPHLRLHVLTSYSGWEQAPARFRTPLERKGKDAAEPSWGAFRSQRVRRPWFLGSPGQFRVVIILSLGPVEGSCRPTRSSGTGLCSATPTRAGDTQGAPRHVLETGAPWNLSHTQG